MFFFVIPKDENASGVSHGGGTADYEAYYVKNEEHQQHQQQQQQQSQQTGHLGVGGGHLQPDPNDPTGQRMTVTPELLGLMPSGTPQYTSGKSPDVLDDFCRVMRVPPFLL